MISLKENYRYFEVEFIMIKIFTTVVHTYLYVISRLTEITQRIRFQSLSRHHSSRPLRTRANIANWQAKMCKSIGRITFLMEPFLARKLKYLWQYRAANNQNPITVLQQAIDQIFEFSRQKWQHQKCDSTNRFAHPLALICDINQENALKTLPCI